MKIRSFSLTACAGVFLTAGVALGITPTEVKQKLAAGQQVTLVDVRSTVAFQEGHVPNAINVPAALVPQKQLPPLGFVVVYDDGLGPDSARAAAEALNRKTGITAEVLEGGYAAWETSRAPTTVAPGLSQEKLPLITYERLKKVRPEELVLVDLRKRPAASPALKTASPGPGGASPVATLTDLGQEFPNVRVVRSPFEASVKKTASSGEPPLLVLIDSGDGGAAREMGRALRANGNQRFAILAGGEEILARQGQAGLQRAGASFTIKNPNSATAPENHQAP